MAVLEEDGTSLDRDHPPEFRIDPGAASLLLMQARGEPGHGGQRGVALPPQLVMGGHPRRRQPGLEGQGFPRDAPLRGPCPVCVCVHVCDGPHILLLLPPGAEVRDFHVLEGSRGRVCPREACRGERRQVHHGYPSSPSLIHPRTSEQAGCHRGSRTIWAPLPKNPVHLSLGSNPLRRPGALPAASG